jgi:hypothetical protein
MIQPSSIPHEYYLGDLPGTIQYKKEKQELLMCELQRDTDEINGFAFCEHSLENLQRVLPHTQKCEDWKILLMMSKEFEGEIWLKAALLNKTSGKVALLTSTNDRNNLDKRNHRAIKSNDGSWFVGHYRMSAPVIFWRELKNRLEY